MANLPVLIFLCFFLSFRTRLSIAADTLYFGQSLSGNRTLISGNGNFELCFFTPGKSQNYFVGIWYHNYPQTVVWVANWGKPLSNPAFYELKISKDGELVVLNTSKVPVWSSHSKSRPSDSVVAVLLGTGNLVLRNGSSQTEVLWQSFDHPTDTLLPDQWIGYNRTAGHTRVLTSWRNSEDPAPGIFSLELDPSGVSQFILLKNGVQQYWSSGIWDESKSVFSNVPEMAFLTSLRYKNLRSPGANCFMFLETNSNFLTMTKIDTAGQVVWLQRLTVGSPSWVPFNSFPRDPCDAPALCGPFGACSPSKFPDYCVCLPGFTPRSRKEWSLGDKSGGCRRRTQLGCAGNDTTGGQKDGFLLVPNVQLPVNSTVLAIRNAQGCEQACSEDCSCTAYSYGRQCLVWKGDLLNIEELSNNAPAGALPGDLYLHLAGSELPVYRSKVRNAHLPLIIGSASAFLVLCAVLVVIWRTWMRLSTGSKEATQGFLVPFRYKDLQRATKNFSEKLGKGGFGSVYKGTLPDLSVVAVKKLEGLAQGDKQFRVEVAALAAVQHVNIVRLRGFCSEGTKRLLVYDYLPNGSLDCYLFPKTSEALDWSLRYQIALGIARGLAYLHEKCRGCIIHCDVKPENILLDEQFSPKVADFGMAKLIGRDFSRVLTTMRGTIGYVAPEWISGVPITPKADVFSFGMMLFEIISGKRNRQASEDESVSFFPAWAARVVSDEEAISVPEHRPNCHPNMDEFRRACRIACWCTQESENDRPTMGQVVQILEGALDVKAPPIPDHLEDHFEEEDMPLEFELHSVPST